MVMLMFLLLAAAEPPVPMTVNDQVLGDPSEFETVGPARLCMDSMAIDLAEGEAGYLEYAGIHRGSFKVLAPEAAYSIVFVDYWQENTRRARTVRKGKSWSIKWSGSKKQPIFHMFVDYDKGEGAISIGTIKPNAPRAWEAHREFLDRLTLSPEFIENCDRRYAYGWPMLMGDKPLSSKPNENNQNNEAME